MSIETSRRWAPPGRWPGGMDSRTSPHVFLPLWISVIEAAAITKLVVSTVLIAVGSGSLAPMQRGILHAHVLFFGVAALVLQVLGRADRRAVTLGIYFLLLAGAWADPLLSALAAESPGFSRVSLLLQHVQVIALGPYFFWIFVRDFPRRHPFPRRDTFVTVGRAATLVIGIVLLLANLYLYVAPDGPATEIARHFDRRRLGSLFWPLLTLGGVPALAYAAWQARRASPDEKRRVRIMLTGIAIGLAPEMLVTSMAGISPQFARYAVSPEGQPLIRAFVYPPMLAIPLITGYAVLVHRALDLRLIARKALQYSLAQYTLAGALTAPFVVIAAVAYLNRDQSLVELWSGPNGWITISALGAGAVLMRTRAQVWEGLDRRFFREQYDSRRILSDLVERTRLQQSLEELTFGLAQEIDRALHLRAVHVLLRHDASGTFTARQGRLRPLSVVSPLARLLEDSATPLEVSWDPPDRWLNALPPDERQWVAEADAHLLVPITGATGSLVGVIALGEKRSELPFSGEDRLLLTTIAGSVALAAEHRLVGQTRSGGSDAANEEAERLARECLGCGIVVGPDRRRCDRCHQSTVRSSVPMVLAGKFRLLERIGRGGMGIVYRAVDLTLDREVAIKTLPTVSAEEIKRLRREARAMAAVWHPNLALIFGAESWKGVPMLVVEYLAGRTLHDRLGVGALSVDETLSLGGALVPALIRLHEANILHRDIKPSNIGFTLDGTPKLLDFGLARVVEAAQHPSVIARQWHSTEPSRTWERTQIESSIAVASTIAGTPMYLSPEAVQWEEPNVSFDLWALSLVLYESCAGRHPFEDSRSVEEAMARIAKADVPDIREFDPDIPTPVAHFFTEALGRDRHRRPASARDLGRRIQELCERQRT